MPHPDYVAAWLLAFGVTVLVESAVLGWLGRRAEPHLWRRLALVLLANLASHPAVWFVFPLLPLGWPATTSLSEMWAWLVEAGVYALAFSRGTSRAALGLSFAANASSFGFGLVLWALGVMR